MLFAATYPSLFWVQVSISAWMKMSQNDNTESYSPPPSIPCMNTMMIRHHGFISLFGFAIFYESGESLFDIDIEFLDFWDQSLIYFLPYLPF